MTMLWFSLQLQLKTKEQLQKQQQQQRLLKSRRLLHQVSVLCSVRQHYYLVISEVLPTKQKSDEAAAVSENKELVVANEEEEFVPEDSAPAAREARFNFCPDGWFNYGSRCFLFVNTAKTWFSAEEHCNGLGGHLASVTNPREYSFLQQMTQISGQSVAWMGGFYLQNQWLWIDREGFYYTNWYSLSTATTYPCIYLNTNCKSTNLLSLKSCSAVANLPVSTKAADRLKSSNTNNTLFTLY
ncbi:uncharacterized protein V6R79_012305 [Siganus canaliculatus]